MIWNSLEITWQSLALGLQVYKLDEQDVLEILDEWYKIEPHSELE